MAAAYALSTALAEARGTGAGTSVASIATATYIIDGAPVTIGSNPATVRVQEVIDVTAQPGSGEAVPANAGDSAQPLPFFLTNLGNGHERFSLKLRAALGGDMFDLSCAQLALDTNSNGRFDPATDANYVPGANDPELRPDQSITVFAVCQLPDQTGSGGKGIVEFEAVASSGSGVPGAALAGLGDAGTDAVIGATGARATARHGFIIVDGLPKLAKSQQVVDPSGGTNPIAGARITYALVATIGSGATAQAMIADPIPTGTTYESGSLRLDDSSLTDAADADAGRFTGQGIEVQLGALAPGAPRTVSFSVRIDQQ